MGKLTLLLSAAGLLVSACSQTDHRYAGESMAPTGEPTLKRLGFESQLDASDREFFVYLPSGYHEQTDRGWPVMLFLHGHGERGNGLDELGYVLNNGPLYEAWVQKRDLPFIIIAPQLPMFGMDEHTDYLRDRDPEQMQRRLEQGTPERPDNFDTPQPMNGVVAPESMDDMSATLPGGWDQIEDDLLLMLDRVAEDYRTDERCLYISGLSYGGFGTWYMGSKHPERFAAMVPVVGWGHPELMAPIAKYELPLWVFAAGRDPVVEIQHFYPGLNRLEELGHPEVRFTNHEDMGHDAWNRVYQSEDLYRWLLEQCLP